jgi:cytochrome c oxidase subunit 6b
VNKTSLIFPEFIAFFVMAEIVENPLKQTIPFDPRFPNMNQTRNCWQNYVDFHRCQKLKGEEYEPCQFFFKNFKTICPNAWVEKWDDQREKGAFPANL